MFYRIDVPAYFNTRTEREVAANSFLVASEEHRVNNCDVITRQGGNPVATRLTAEQYRAAALAKLGR